MAQNGKTRLDGESVAESLGHRGPIVLGASEIGWHHGGEDTLEMALDVASDLSDMSDELADRGSSWPATADSARERGHLLRALDLTKDMRVLEVGAGCGGVSRFLAERCGALDALEPNPDRARLAAMRLGELEHARVLVGEVDHLPPGESYDLIVLVGVLEYVGGWRSTAERIDFLGRLAERLRPGGHLVCAIENRLGVCYLAGHPDDHSGLLFQGPEDHPWPNPSRTFSRRELESLFVAAGLLPTTLGVFPDYRFPRMVFSSALLESDAIPLAWRVPAFPSPPHGSHPRAAIMDERRIWRSFVTNGLGMEFANSFLVVAGRDDMQTLWPEDQLAAFYSSAGRRRRFSTETKVKKVAHGVVLERRPLGSTTGRASALVQRCATEPYLTGDSLIELLAEADDNELCVWLKKYREFLGQQIAASTGAMPFDIWPGNVIVVGGALVVVDTELAIEGVSEADVLWRSLLLTAFELSSRTFAARWGVATVGELVSQLARAAGIEGEIEVERGVRLQAELMAEIFGGDPGSEAWRLAYNDSLRANTQYLARTVTENVFDARDAGAGLRAGLENATTELEALRVREGADRKRVELLGAELGAERRRVIELLAQQGVATGDRERMSEQLARAEDALARTVGSRSWRYTTVARAAGRWLRARRH
jgi:SAM-dependent methyltransferase